MIETLVKGLRYWKPCCSNLQIYLQFIDFNVPLYCICLSLGWLKRLFQQLANLTAFHFFVLYMPSSLSLWWFKLLIAKSLVDWNSCYKPTTCKYPCTALLSLTMDHSKCVPQENAKPICLIYQFSAIKFGQIKGHLIYVSLKQQCLMPATMYIVLHIAVIVHHCTQCHVVHAPSSGTSNPSVPAFSLPILPIQWCDDMTLYDRKIWCNNAIL